MTSPEAAARKASLADIDRTRVVVTSGPLTGTVLSRVVGISASRADLPVDRLDEALMLADVIAAHAPAQVVDGRIELTCRTSEGCLEMRLGPLRRGGATRLLEESAVPGAGNVIKRLATEARVIDRGEDELLVIQVAR